MSSPRTHRAARRPFAAGLLISVPNAAVNQVGVSSTAESNVWSFRALRSTPGLRQSVASYGRGFDGRAEALPCLIRGGGDGTG